MQGRIILAIAASPSVAGAAPHFQSFDVPGAASACGNAIAGSGIVTGLAYTSPAPKNFLYEPTTGAISFPAPNLPPYQMSFKGITQEGTILITQDYGPLPQGYLYHNNSIATLVELAGIQNHAYGINDRGDLFGSVEVNVSDNRPFSGLVGFVVQPSGKVTTINDGSYDIRPTAIDVTGKRVVGYTQSGLFFSKFGKFTYLKVPGATWGATASGVNRHDHVSGTYYTGSNTPVANGFLFHHGTYTTWNVPGASATEINGENEAEQITGCYTDANGTHGFVATP